MGASSRKYLCEFRGRCPNFDNTKIVCLKKPWMCSNWAMHIQILKEGKKPILDSKDFSFSNIMGRETGSSNIDPMEIKLLRERLLKELKTPSPPTANKPESSSSSKLPNYEHTKNTMKKPPKRKRYRR